MEHSQPRLLLGPGRPERSTHDHFRHGTVSLFAALDVQTGKVIGQYQARHTQRQFPDFLKRIDAATPCRPRSPSGARQLRDPQDSCRAPLARASSPIPLHFIPTHSSWLDQVESWFAKITSEAIRRGSFRSVPHLRQTIFDYIAAINRDPQPFTWTASADLILCRVANLCGELA